MAPHSEATVSYSQFSCIGTGFSAVGLGATLKRWYGIDDIKFFEKHETLGGTWFISQYPGCACDVPSVLYSYSYEANPNWSRVLPSRGELWAYLNNVATKYDLKRHMSFSMEVQRCEWIEESARWRMSILHVRTNTILTHECQFLFCATGQLVKPREIDVPGSESFSGAIFHTARWRTDVDLKGKRVVVFGNGCTGAQVVPSLVKDVKSLTQFVRAKHWILPPIDGEIPSWAHAVLRWLPGLMGLQRLLVFLAAEANLLGFPLTEGARRFRARQRSKAENYMRSTAPAKYHELLIPDFEVGCKRRIFDSGYLDSLHAGNLTLTDEKPLEIVPRGVRTATGVVEADAIVLANGFITNEFLIGLNVRGRGGKTIQEHWESFGGAEAYNCSVLSGFPNMFILLGPNAATGHTSAIMASENSVNYALRVIRPLLHSHGTIAELKLNAEKDYSNKIQAALRKTVWNTGCQSWYVTEAKGDSREGWNAMSYPWSQAHFWYRSVFPVWGDWTYRGKVEEPRTVKTALTSLLLLAVAVGCYWKFHDLHQLAEERSTFTDIVKQPPPALQNWKTVLIAWVMSLFSSRQLSG